MSDELVAAGNGDDGPAVRVIEVPPQAEDIDVHDPDITEGAPPYPLQYRIAVQARFMTKEQAEQVETLGAQRLQKASSHPHPPGINITPPAAI